MVARLIPAPAPELPHQLVLPDQASSGSWLADVQFGVEGSDLRGALNLEAGDWLLNVSELRQLLKLLVERGLHLQHVAGQQRHTLVAAAALGLPTTQRATRMPTALDAAGERPTCAGVSIHQGPLRSGEHLQSRTSVLLLGDVNPGGRISAEGHVLVWGRLRGIAHAGSGGDRSATIVALQLRPLQLRIADVVARGPDDAPAMGMAEQARLVDGVIRIDPASPLWPVHTDRG